MREEAYGLLNGSRGANQGRGSEAEHARPQAEEKGGQAEFVLCDLPMNTLSARCRSALEGIDRILVYRTPMAVRFRRVTSREGVLLHGTGGWGEAAPFAEYEAEESSRWLVSALEAARDGAPDPLRETIPVNVIIPVMPPTAAAQRAANSGCATAKIKVADPGISLAQDCERVAAVTDALVRSVGRERARIRIDVNGSWDVDEACRSIATLNRAVEDAGGLPLEYVEQPCASVEELAEVRRRIDVPLAADESIRRADDPYAVAAAQAADVAIVKVAPLGGGMRALQIARDLGLRVVISSALETSVGLAYARDVARSLDGEPLACGLATASLLARDVTRRPLLPLNGALPGDAVSVDEALLTAPDEDLRGAWRARCHAMAEFLQAR